MKSRPCRFISPKMWLQQGGFFMRTLLWEPSRFIGCIDVIIYSLVCGNSWDPQLAPGSIR